MSRNEQINEILKKLEVAKKELQSASVKFDVRMDNIRRMLLRELQGEK